MRDEHAWPLKNRLPHDYRPFTKLDLLEMLDHVGDDEPVWIDNYWQPVRQITQRPVALMYVHDDGFHVA